jgi:hypothetical protein
LDRRQLMNCIICGTEFNSEYQTKITCSRECQKEQNNRNTLRNYRKNKGKKTGFKCPCCEKMRSASKWTFCKWCKCEHDRSGVVDTISQEHNVGY